MLQLLNAALGGGTLPLVLVTCTTNDGSPDMNGNELHWSACGSWAARLLYVLLKAKSRQSEDGDKNRAFSGGDLTWGEFLLLLAISNKEGMSESEIDAMINRVQGEGDGEGVVAFSALSRPDRVVLRKKCLLNDHEWAMLPLNIPLDMKSHPDNKNPFLPPLWLSNAGNHGKDISFIDLFQLLYVW